MVVSKLKTRDNQQGEWRRSKTRHLIQDLLYLKQIYGRIWGFHSILKVLALLHNIFQSSIFALYDQTFQLQYLQYLFKRWPVLGFPCPTTVHQLPHFIINLIQLCCWVSFRLCRQTPREERLENLEIIYAVVIRVLSRKDLTHET